MEYSKVITKSRAKIHDGRCRFRSMIVRTLGQGAVVFTVYDSKVVAGGERIMPPISIAGSTGYQVIDPGGYIDCENGISILMDGADGCYTCYYEKISRS